MNGLPELSEAYCIVSTAVDNECGWQAVEELAAVLEFVGQDSTKLVLCVYGSDADGALKELQRMYMNLNLSPKANM
jgi:hypothetical protein